MIQLREQVNFTKGRIIVRRKLRRGEQDSDGTSLELTNPADPAFSNRTKSDSPNVDRSDTRGPRTALDHLGLEDYLYIFRLPILGSVCQYFLHPMFVDEKLTRRH